MKQILIAIGLALLAAGASAQEDAATQWPRFRGPRGDGHTAEKGIPVEWNKANVLWKAPLKGEGQSSPVVWGDRIFLTSAVDGGKQRLVFCVDRKSGKILWEKVAWKGAPEKSHKMNGWATPTCVTDGERVYASFGFAGLHCYTVDGKPVWSRNLGKFESPNGRGTAASPILVDGLVIFNGDSQSDPFLFGLDKLTGKTLWKSDRPATEGYSTPIVVDAGRRRELVLNGDPYVAGFDIKSGKRLWWCKSFKGRGEPLPAFADGVLYVVNGLPSPAYAVRPGGSGDVTKSHMVWSSEKRRNRDTPSPIVSGKFLLVCDMKGILTCYDRGSGKELWKERLTGATITAAPFAAEGRVYFIDEKGDTRVVLPGPEMKILATNTLGASNEMFRASPAPYRGRLYIRSNTALYCIGARK